MVWDVTGFSGSSREWDLAVPRVGRAQAGSLRYVPGWQPGLLRSADSQGQPQRRHAADAVHPVLQRQAAAVGVGDLAA